MDRKQIFPGQIPLETDLLGTNKNVMIALGKLSAAVFGTASCVNGLTVGPNSPAALNVVVQPGELYSLQNIDGTAYSSIAADTAHQIVKQGILLDTSTLSTPAPATAGFSINYLIQAAFSEVDTDAVVLPYYNATNPTQAYSGPANAGTANNTTRKDTIILSAKAGIAATTGTQTTPAADAGYIGLYVVTVANGQTTVTAPNIAQVSGAPILSETLIQKISQASADVRYAALAGLASQVFSVATPTASAHATPLSEFAALLSGSGYIKIPVIVDGVKRTLIVQWGTVSINPTNATNITGWYAGTATATLPISFPNAVLRAFVTPSNSPDTSICIFGDALTSLGSITAICWATNNADTYTGRYLVIGY